MMGAFRDQRIEGTFGTPSIAQPSVRGAVFQTTAINPFAEALRNATNGNSPVRPLISYLCFLCHPPHVADFVMAIGIFTIQRVLRCRFVANMVDKCGIGRKAKFDAAPAIVFICWVAGIVTPSLCSLKCNILRSPCVAVCCRTQGRCLTVAASARRGGPRPQVVCVHRDDFSTLAQAKPTAYSSKAENGQPCKLQPGHITKPLSLGKWVKYEIGHIIYRYFNMKGAIYEC